MGTTSFEAVIDRQM